jgi:hypothetical protein
MKANGRPFVFAIGADENGWAGVPKSGDAARMIACATAGEWTVRSN